MGVKGKKKKRYLPCSDTSDLLWSFRLMVYSMLETLKHFGLRRLSVPDGPSEQRFLSLTCLRNCPILENEASVTSDLYLEIDDVWR